MSHILQEPPLRPPANEEEFELFMKAMDRRFQEHFVGIPARSLAAFAEVMRAYDLDYFDMPKGEPRPGLYEARDVALRAFQWFDEHYGRAQAKYWGPGHGLVVLKGSVWKIKYPGIFGRAGFRAGDFAVVGTDNGYVEVRLDSPEWQDTKLIKCDVLDCVMELPPEVRSSLERHELVGILTLFCQQWLLLGALYRARSLHMFELARTNLESAVDTIVRRGEPGLAKWAALEAAEKALKSYLLHVNETYPTSGRKGHDVIHLAGLVAAAGGPQFPVHLLEEVQCRPSVRYQPNAVTHREAFRAHYVAVEIAGTSAAFVKGLVVERPAT